MSQSKGFEKLKEASWFPFSDEPVIKGLWYVPRLSCISFLFPEESIDQKWHLFAHSWLGIQHYSSDSGIMWEPVQMVQLRGKHPFLFKDKNQYHLIYERHGALIPFVERLSKKGKKEHIKGSHIEMRSSSDLNVWSEPKVLFKATDALCASDYLKNPLIGHPQLIKVDGGYRLYFGASKVGFNPSSARYICSAFSKNIDGPYELESEVPILEANPNSKYSNLAVGRLSIYKEDQQYIGFQNGRYWDDDKKKESSAITIVESNDGLSFSECDAKPVLTPVENSWASKHIVSCDVRYKKDEDCWYCYYSATGQRKGLLVKESIGLMIGKFVRK